MATNTYVALKTTTLVGSTPSVTLDNIPQGYTDLVLVSTLNRTTTNTGSIGIRIKFNGDSGSNYSYTRVYSAPASDRGSNQNYISPWNANDPNFGMVNLINIQNYSNSTTYKTVIGRASAGDSNGYAYGNVAMWRSTAAITSIEITAAENFISGSVVLYGVAAEGALAKATGGAIYSDSQYWYHAFANSGTFTPTQSLTADILVVAGGGGGGGGGSTWANGGGGGAGGLLGFSAQSLTATGYTVTVGGGGTGGATYAKGASGTDSQFGALTLVKGGGAAGGYNVGTGSTGGSGGGGAGLASGGNTGGSATSGQGYAGGNGNNSANDTGNGGGGGGAGGAGENANTDGSNYGGDGGLGVSTYNTWSLATGIGQDVSGTYYLAGGGGGGAGTVGNFGSGGLGGGGNGGNGNANGSNGLIYSGSGGGGCGAAGSGGGTTGGNGGSGIVVVRYAK